jgi:phage major head subunit gpT-like protein
MLLTPQNLSFFFNTLETRYWLAYTKAPRFIDEIATTYNVDSEQWVSGWLDQVPKFRRWDGARVTRSPAPETYIVPIDAYELTLNVDQFKIMDDKMGIYGSTAVRLAQQAAKNWDYQLRDLLQNTGVQTGARQYGTDGNLNFYTAHPVNVYNSAAGTFTNDYRGGFVSGSLTLGGALTSSNALASIWQNMSAIPDQSGEPLGIMPNKLMVPSQLRQTSVTLLQGMFVGQPQVGFLGSGTGAGATLIGTTDNVATRGLMEMLLIPELNAQPTTYYTLDTQHAGGIKPFSLLLRQAPNFVYIIDPTHPYVFGQHQYVWGSYMRGNPAWAFPFLSSISSP